MAVYIPEVQCPKRCCDCFAYNGWTDICPLFEDSEGNSGIFEYIINDTKPNWCKLQEVKGE